MATNAYTLKKTILITCLTLILVLTFGCETVLSLKNRAFSHPGGMHPKEKIIDVREKIQQGDRFYVSAYQKLKEQADANLNREPNAPEDFSVPGYYDDPEGHRAAMDQLSLDAWAGYSCALAWQYVPDNERVKYAEHAKKVILNWATVNKKASNYDGDLAMADAGAGLVFAAELLSDFSGWTDTEQNQFEEWLKLVYMPTCQKIVYEPNNWGDWGILGLTAAHYFLDDEDEMDDDIAILQARIDKTINADGSMPEEVKRDKRGLWYTYFALAPLTAACQIAYDATETDLFKYKGNDGAGIEEALDYLLKYTVTPDGWPHFDGKLNMGSRTLYPGNLFEAMYGIYEKQEYLDYLKDARPLIVFGHHYAWALPTL